MKLTEKYLLGHPRPAVRSVLTDGKGLRARGGRRGWVFYFQARDTSGEWRSVTLGPWSKHGGGSTLSLRQAEAKASALRESTLSAPSIGVSVRDAVDAVLGRYTERDRQGRALKDDSGEPVLTHRGQRLRGVLEQHALCFVLPGGRVLGEQPLASIKPAELRAVVEASRAKRKGLRLMEGQMREATLGGEGAAATLLQGLKAVWKWAVKDGLLDYSVAASVDLGDLGIRKAKRKRILTDAEVSQLLEHAKGWSIGIRAMAVLLLHTGLRTAAVVKSKRKAVDVKARTLTVLGSLKKATVDEKRMADDFLCPLSPSCLVVLRELDERYGADREWLIPSPANQRRHISPAALIHQMGLDQDAEKLVLPGGYLVGHDLRRSWASTAVRACGVEALVVERQLWHSLDNAGLSAVAGVYLVDDAFDRRRAAVEAVDAHWASQRSRGHVRATR